MYICGIDPGLGITGVCVIDERNKIKFCAAVNSKGIDCKEPLFKTTLMAGRVAQVVLDCRYKPGKIVIEHPIFAKHPLVFAKQVRLLHAIELRLLDGYAELVEVLPSALRQILGLRVNEKKRFVTDLFKVEYPHHTGNKLEVEAAADAWAIALCGGDERLWHERMRM